MRIIVFSLLLPGKLLAQDFLEQFSYEGLGVSGIAFQMGRVVSDRLTTEWSPAIRVDYGMIAPRIRVMFGANYFKAELNAEEIAEFESRLISIVQDPTGDAVIDVGRITWTNVEAALDLQYMFPSGKRFTAYVGVGVGVHLRNGAGPTIEDTFVEDALDTVGAGANVTLGVEVAVTDRFHLTSDARGGLTSELLLGSLSIGVLYRILQGGN